ncbi:PH domain-containing protein [Halorubrum sp. Boch-26]|uniref:PH domain-containing protein n=1 Tax=Halorubrum sp. Boch-26 TaxID=2994426 RepID=UPI002468F02E|nr:PH domain-containing protein [Halorubrum sp. Boch-26]
MSDDWWYRRDSERVVWRGRPRLSAALPGIGFGAAVCAAAIAAAVVVDPRLIAGGVLGIGVAAWAVLQVRRTSYVLTTRAVWAKRGVVGLTVRRVTLEKVQNTAYNQSVSGSAFGYGTVTIEVAGGRDLRFRRVSDPKAVQRTVADRSGGTDDTVPGTTAQWRSLLRLVREIRSSVE